MLAPATVLAQQHWRTLSERFAPSSDQGFPAEQVPDGVQGEKTILEGLKQGTIDAVVGTHQLLNKGAAFDGARAAGGG